MPDVSDRNRWSTYGELFAEIPTQEQAVKRVTYPSSFAR